jgi:hypothetical protein
VLTWSNFLETIDACQQATLGRQGDLNKEELKAVAERRHRFHPVRRFRTFHPYEEQELAPGNTDTLKE